MWITLCVIPAQAKFALKDYPPPPPPDYPPLPEPVLPLPTPPFLQTFGRYFLTTGTTLF